MFEFDEDTAITSAGDGVFRGVVTGRWDVIHDGPPNGGYVMGIGARAMLAAAEHPHPTTVTAHFLRPMRHGPVEVQTRIVKIGRRFSTISASMMQEGVENVRLLGAFSDLDGFEGPTFIRRPRLDLPPLDQCLEPDAKPETFEPPPIFRRWESRPVPEDMGWAIGKPSGNPLLRSWVRFADRRPMDALGLLALSDALTPAIFGADVVRGWVPTVELTVHLRRPGPFEGFLACSYQSQWLTNGLFEEDGVIEDAEGNPVALSRQLALAPA